MDAVEHYARDERCAEDERCAGDERCLTQLNDKCMMNENAVKLS